MHLHISSIFCHLALVFGVAGQLQYWLDDTCLHYPLPMGQELSLRPYLKEMFYMAGLANKRMNNDKLSKDLRDVEFRRMFKHVFKTDLDPDNKQQYEYGLEYKEFFGFEDGSSDAKDTAFNIVANTLESISTVWTETENRLEADNRIYCDNGRHFSKPGGKGEYVDPINNVYATGNCDRDDAETYAFVTCELYDTTIESETDGCLLTVCDKAMADFRYPGTADSTADKPFILSELIKAETVTGGLGLDKHAGLASMLLHEWSHSQPHLTEDWYIGDNEETGATGEWKCLLDIPDTRRAAINAEAISYISLFALLVEGAGSPEGHFYGLQLDYEDLQNKEHPNIAKIEFYN